METNRKVVGMGETVFDILFQGGQPQAAVHGGSTFNSIISVGRAGVPCTFVGYTGDDIVGRQTAQFLLDNGVGTDHFQLRHGEKSTVSLAFLADNGDASYIFHGLPPHLAPSWTLPDLASGDVLLFGSYYALCPAIRPQVEQMLRMAAEAGSAVYYDINFRPAHLPELPELLPVMRRNMSQSTVVRGSVDDFDVVFSTRDARDIYNMYVRPHCPVFICTAGAGRITVCTPTLTHDFLAPPVAQVVSTVGAGDSFNAGFACALIWHDIKATDLPTLGQDAWAKLIATACRFASETCQSQENYIRPHSISQPI